MRISTKDKAHFLQTGYFILENFISEKDVCEIKSRIESSIQEPGAVVFFDRHGHPRRLERFTYRDPRLIDLMQDVGHYVSDIVGEEQVLFKDKVNFKPPGGEGFNAHYDGIFEYRSPIGKVGRGWFDYADRFTNALITLDRFTDHNGALEIANRHVGDFERLLKNTKRDGSPDLIKEVVLGCVFNPIFCGSGSLIVFDSACPHRSGKNRSEYHRSTIYWTYHSATSGSHYDRYFDDKASSLNQNKALTGEV
jgi:2-aminoethylphosphonate dioxygenase